MASLGHGIGRGPDRRKGRGPGRKPRETGRASRETGRRPAGTGRGRSSSCLLMDEGVICMCELILVRLGNLCRENVFWSLHV